ncbi:MAG TPA: tyrosine-type recombinase/integrase [Miltoncostaeaceae bacterium]|nr:tyrosine-type recombinase/integrase [Miltoncostaeaceae bacterium]
MPTTWEASLQDLERRLASQGGRGRRLSPRTQATYLADARRLAAWLEEHGVAGPEAVGPSALEAAFRGLGWSAATRARAVTSAREWLGPLHPPGRSPADLVARPRPAPPPVPRLSQADAAALVDRVGADAAATPVARALALRDRALMEVLYGSGLRRQEACDLVLAGLDFEHESVRVVGKGGAARTVPLTEPAVAALQAWLREGRPRLVSGQVPVAAVRAPVFVSRGGRALDGSTVYRVVARELRAAGRAGGPHLLRHAAGTHLLEGPGGEGGAHLRVVQEVLGHASLATTQRYTGVTTRTMQALLRQGHPRG